MSELLNKWKPIIIGSGIGGKVSENKDWQEFIAEVIESQYQYNRFVFKGDSQYQGYSMPIVCVALKQISNKIQFPDYLSKQRCSKVFSGGRIISIDLPKCDDIRAIENIAMEDVRHKVEKLIYLKINRGSFRIGPIMSHVKYSNNVLEYELSV